MITSTKEQFIQDLINTLNDENENRINNNKTSLDICFMVSVIDQQIENCKEFLDDITKNTYYINGYDEDYSGGYTNGKITILIRKLDNNKEEYVDYYNYYYCIEFNWDERHLGYCECTSKDKNYNDKHKCCGIECDFIAPSLNISKIINLGNYSWEGQEKDYWRYEDQFKINEQYKNKEIIKFRIKQKRKQLKDKIVKLKKELEKLN